MQNYQSLYQIYYQNNNNIQNRNFSFGSMNDLASISSLSKKRISINQSPSRPAIFQVPKQREISNFNYGARTPSPSHNRRDIININLNNNSKFKQNSNSPVYRKLPGIDSLDVIPQNNTMHIRNISLQPLNLRIYYNNNNNSSNINSFLPNSPSYINIEHKVPRLARTPEPRKNNFDVLKQNNHNVNYSNNINNNIIYYNNNAKYGNKPINNFKNEKPIEIFPLVQ